MSTGPLGPGECVDKQIQGISNVLSSTSTLIDPNAFINPQAVNIANMFQSSANSRQEVDSYRAYLMTMVPPPPDLMQLLSQADSFEQQLTNFDSAVGQYQIWTNFSSGTLQSFPANLDMGLIFGGSVPVFAGVLGGLTFAGLLGAAKGGNQADYAKCQGDPNDPCAKVNKILGSVLGLTDTLINAMISGMNMMLDFVAHILDYIAQMVAFVEGLIAVIANAIAELINTVVQAIRDGLARLLDKIKIDPCLGKVISNCAGPGLAAALSL